MALSVGGPLDIGTKVIGKVHFGGLNQMVQDGGGSSLVIRK